MAVEGPIEHGRSPHIICMAKKWPLDIDTYILIPLVKVLSDGGMKSSIKGFV